MVRGLQGDRGGRTRGREENNDESEQAMAKTMKTLEQQYGSDKVRKREEDEIDNNENGIVRVTGRKRELGRFHCV